MRVASDPLGWRAGTRVVWIVSSRLVVRELEAESMVVERYRHSAISRARASEELSAMMELSSISIVETISSLTVSCRPMK